MSALCPPNRAGTSGRGRVAAGVLVALVVGTALSLARQPGPVPAWDSMWAEDGGRFVGEALEHGRVGALWRPYAGYLHMWPRMVATVAATVPVELVATVMALAAALSAAALAVLAFLASRDHIPSVLARGVAAALIVLAPTASIETANVTASTQFIAVPVALWLVARRAPSTWWAVLAGAVSALVVLSSPAAVVVAPIALLRAWWGPARRDRVAAGTFLIASAVQLAVIAVERAAQDVSSALGFVQTLGQRVVAPTALGHTMSGEVWVRGGWAGVAVVCLAVAALIVVGALTGSDRRRAAVILAGGAGLASAVMALWARDASRFMLWPPGEGWQDAQRLSVTSVLCLSFALAAALAEAPSASLQRPWCIVGGVAAAVIAVAVVIDFAPSASRSEGPPWREQVTTARATCDDGEVIRIEHAPPGWALRVPCERLR